MIKECSFEFTESANINGISNIRTKVTTFLFSLGIQGLILWKTELAVDEISSGILEKLTDKKHVVFSISLSVKNKNINIAIKSSGKTTFKITRIKKINLSEFTKKGLDNLMRSYVLNRVTDKLYINSKNKTVKSLITPD